MSKKESNPMPPPIESKPTPPPGPPKKTKSCDCAPGCHDNEMKWISVKDKLPETSGLYFVCVDLHGSYAYAVVWYCKEYGFGFLHTPSTGAEPQAITHYMEPLPPK